MKKIFLQIILFTSFYTLEAQQFNTEIGIRLLNLELNPDYHFFEIYGRRYYENTDYNLKFRQQNNVRYNGPIGNLKGSFSSIAELKTIGIYTPSIFIRHNIWNRLWLQGAFSFYSLHTISTQPFSFQIGSMGTEYDYFDVKTKGVNLEYSLQYQWIHRKRISIASGVEAQMNYGNVRNKSIGYVFGGFGGSELKQYNVSQLTFVRNIRAIQSVRIPIYKTYTIFYELAFPFLNQRISISKSI